MTGFYEFLRYNEISSLRCCDLQFRQCDGAKFVELYILKSKTDVYRDGSKVLLSHNGGASCPYGILKRYVDTAKLQLSSSDPLFSRLQYLTSTKSYKVRAGMLSYTRTREIVLQALASMGNLASMKFGLHSLRSGGRYYGVGNCERWLR